jgi:hypothetical protein
MTARPVVMAVAAYHAKAGAEADFRALWSDGPRGGLAPLAAALVEKGADGRLTIDRHRCAAEPPAWEGAVLGSALTVVAAPVGIHFLVAVVDTGAVLGGIGAIVGHFWNNVPKDQLRQMSELLETSQAALVVVAADETDDTVRAWLAGADVAAVALTWADIDHDYFSAIEEAKALG